MVINLLLLCCKKILLEFWLFWCMVVEEEREFVEGETNAEAVPSRNNDRIICFNMMISILY